MVGRLSNSQIQQLSQQVPDWTVEGDYLKLIKRFKNFIEAIEFVNKLVEPSEVAGHHPDLEISYNKVTISLTTHDAGGLTEKDFALAQQISALG
ncbi:4a-hydroxytetrahydrobiopterin dehydratase [Planktothrix mougeotii]|uniref:Putative pterin-4-alpha-carbinolamine dehydratase n=1 Tax=Planktothrix mougeotii LEGE 06226 TaxID=1828728 RepID=A0ABR9U7C5_9CYAN|nr:4a-hydroxytetrahydrobiopterin dehydratase [Planktothrix mougeotii]MBE9142360.1 4a-hydroxytetrahydrobiopterin dehydratase [Planktothrix mougeotii LEGE 06226]